jgi:2-dehydro-3-deoxy-D-arabinonate dehydratase
VYDARRPELFFKSVAWRVVGDGEPIARTGGFGVEHTGPELPVLNAAAEIVGYTIGNDVSSRSIEGENPLYLPQAKVYTRSCALGRPSARSGRWPTRSNLAIHRHPSRAPESVVWSATTSSAQLPPQPGRS